MTGPETRASLLIRLRSGAEQEAWSEFIGIYEPLIYRLARSKGLQHADALDLAQEVFTAVSNSIDRFDPDPNKGSFRGWLFRIARNLVINFLSRQKGPQGSGDTAIHELLVSQPAHDVEAETQFRLEYQRELFRWTAQRIRPAFHEETWRAFWLTGVEGQPIQAVAKLLDKTPGAIRIARCRVLARLKLEIAHFGDPGEPPA